MTHSFSHTLLLDKWNAFLETCQKILGKDRVHLFKIRMREFGRNFFSDRFFSMKCSSGHLNVALTTLPKKWLRKNLKYFALNRTNFRKKNKHFETQKSLIKIGQKRFSLGDVESSSYIRAEKISQIIWHFFAQLPKNIAKNQFNHEQYFSSKATFDR